MDKPETCPICGYHQDEHTFRDGQVGWDYRLCPEGPWPR